MIIIIAPACLLAGIECVTALHAAQSCCPNSSCSVSTLQLACRCCSASVEACGVFIIQSEHHYIHVNLMISVHFNLSTETK